MKVAASTLVSLLLAPLAASASLSFFGNDQAVVNGALDVPGSSPLTYCSENYKDDILIIDHVNLYPNPPIPGQNLTIEAVGVFREPVEEGSTTNLQVKYGLITLLRKTVDTCEQLGNVDLTCPISVGQTVVTKEVEIPEQIPSGKYTVTADVYTAEPDKRRITCLTAQVVFSREL